MVHLRIIQAIQVGLEPMSPSLYPQSRGRYWLGISLLTPLYFGLISLFYSTGSDYIIQDDARLHLTWLQHWVDPQLFPADAIADYYTAIQPWGLHGIYRCMAGLGLNSLLFAKLAPLGLALITTAYIYGATLRLLPVPVAGVLTTLILNQNIWLKDDLISATPRAFVYPTFAAFLYYLLQGNRPASLIALVLQGVFYPQMMLVSLGILTLQLAQQLIRQLSDVTQRPQPFCKTTHFQVLVVWLMALVLTGGLLLAFSHQVTAQVGPIINLDSMQAMPEFQPGGRRAYFGASPLQFSFAGASGLRFPLFPPIIFLGIFLPYFAYRTSHRFQSRLSTWFPLAAHLTPQTRVLAELLFSALGLFLLAHLIFPTLYLPSRFSFYSNRFVMAIASGLVLTLVLQRSGDWLTQQETEQSWTKLKRIVLGLGSSFAIAIVVVPAIPSIFLDCQGWVEGQHPALYQTIALSPKDSVIAGIDREINNVPGFSQRSILVGEEFALPYHRQFYDVMLKRMSALLQAQYSPEPEKLRTFIQRYGIDAWVVHQDFATSAYLEQQTWLSNSSISNELVNLKQQLEQGKTPALLESLTTCASLEEKQLILLDAQCITESTQSKT